MNNTNELSVPEWLKYKGKSFTQTLSVVSQTVAVSKIATVCKEARCPNKTECWSSGTATFMLMGDICSRGCRFCAVKTSSKPPPLNPDEPKNLVKALTSFFGFNYIVLTSVNRDDLNDGGAKHLADCIREIKKNIQNLKVEILIPDFEGSIDSVKKIVDAKPDVISHNVETIERLQKKIRDSKANYIQSLRVLQAVKTLDPSIFTKSSLMLGLGETQEEIIKTMKDLLLNNVNFLTLGQYMRPTLKHIRVKKYLPPSEFSELQKIGLKLGFSYVASGPLVRSSYKAGEFFMNNVIQKSKSSKPSLS